MISLVIVRILITGRPGAGKTTLIRRLSERIPSACGVYTAEIREKGKRVGFDAVNIRTGERVPIARVGVDSPRVGKYVVYLAGIERMVSWFSSCGNVIFIDEIGPMELKHPRFAGAVVHAAKKAKVFVATVHIRLAEQWRDHLNADLIRLTVENRNDVFADLFARLKTLL